MTVNFVLKGEGVHFIGLFCDRASRQRSPDACGQYGGAPTIHKQN
jgi:hypothetical protein